MARGFLRIYRTYNMIDKDPAIDQVRTLIQDEGLFSKGRKGTKGGLGAVSEISGVSTTTLDGWFFGETKRPQNATIQAVITSLGYRNEYVKDHDIDIEKERKLGLAWQEKQQEAREKAAPKAKRNGGKK